MRIAIACHPTQGGSGIVATELARALADRGHNVHLISYELPYRLGQSSKAKFHKVNITEYPLFTYPPYDLSLINKMVEVTLKFNIEIIHAHYAIPHAICAIFARHIVNPYKVKIIATLHGTDITLVGSHPDFYLSCRYAMIQADELTVVSKWLKEKTLAKFNLQREPVVIPNFIDPSVFNDDDRSEYPQNEEFIISHASNFRPVKRIFDIIRVFERIQQKLPSRLILCGDGPEVGIARELCAELGIANKVEFSGSVIAIEQVLKKSHLYLLLSDYESFGLSALEAMACGTPVIASNAGGITEVVRDGIDGYLCKVGDIDASSKKAIEILQSREKWCAFSKNAAKFAREKFSLNSIICQYEDLYRKLLEKREEQ